VRPKISKVECLYFFFLLLSLEIFLSIEESASFSTAVFDAHSMKLVAEHSRSAEENTDIRISVLIRQSTKHSIPIRSTEMGRRSQTGNRITFGTDILHQNVVHVVFLDLGRQIDANLDSVLGILLFDRVKKGMEPFGGAKVTDDPHEVDLGETSWLGVVEVVHAIPDRLEDRGEWRNTNTSTDE